MLGMQENAVSVFFSHDICSQIGVEIVSWLLVRHFVLGSGGVIAH